MLLLSHPKGILHMSGKCFATEHPQLDDTGLMENQSCTQCGYERKIEALRSYARHGEP